MDMSDSKQKVDRLLEEARLLQKRSEVHEKTSGIFSQTTDSLKEIQKDLGFIKRSILDIREGWLGIVENVLKPLWFIFGPPFNLIARFYKRIWNRFAYTTEKISGHRRLSRRRSGVLVGLTLIIVAMFTPTGVGSFIRFFTVEPIVDGILMTTSMRIETFYLNNTEEIEPEENIHSVRGCKSEGVCAEKDAVYFRVKPRLAHDIWKFINYSNPIYVPDHVVAPIAPGVNKCSVTYYGYRMTSSWIARLLRSLQLYPVMLEASCTYVGRTSEISDLDK